MPDRHMPVKHLNASGAFALHKKMLDNSGMKQLASIRKSKGLTQRQLGEMVGLDQATISKIERSATGYNYTADVMRALCHALDVEPAELFGLPELQQRVIDAIRDIKDPARREAALVVIEAMRQQPR